MTVGRFLAQDEVVARDGITEDASARRLERVRSSQRGSNLCGAASQG